MIPYTKSRISYTKSLISYTNRNFVWRNSHRTKFALGQVSDTRRKFRWFSKGFSSKCVFSDFRHFVDFTKGFQRNPVCGIVFGPHGIIISYTKLARDETFVYEISDFVYEIWPETNLTAQKRHFIAEMSIFDDFTNGFSSNAFCDFRAPDCAHFVD